MNDQSRYGLSGADEMTSGVVRPYGLEWAAAGMRDDTADPVATATSELIRHIGAIAEPR